MNFPLQVLSLGALIAVAGCGATEQRKPTFRVTGKILAGKEPAVRATVVFHPANPDANDKTPNPTAKVEADGTFTLGTYTADDGAPAGEYAVTIEWYLGPESHGGDAESGPDRLGGRYKDPKTTPLHAKVQEGDNQLPAFIVK